MKQIPSDMVAGTRHMTNNFGELEIVEYLGWDNTVFRFISTGYVGSTHSRAIREGTVKDHMAPCVFGVGFKGVGKYDSKNKLYYVWHAMMQRCYDPKYQAKQPTYIGCSVCDEWHNFQNFAEWAEPRYKEGLALDKDIKVSGNKIYSPDTCTFVTQTENNIASKAKTYYFRTPNKSRRVIVTNLEAFCRRLGLSSGNMCAVHAGKRNHHKGWTAA